jgi:hypothetical protein
VKLERFNDARHFDWRNQTMTRFNTNPLACGVKNSHRGLLGQHRAQITILSATAARLSHQKTVLFCPQT